MKRLAPDAGIIVGVVLTVAGYLLPWFRLESRFEWWYSGWRYLSEGAGWTWWVFVWLALALIGGLWAGNSLGAATAAVVGTVAAAVFIVSTVAFSFAQYDIDAGISWAKDMPFGIGLPVLAVGLGLLLANGVRAIAVNAFDH
ncbi:hypothetical protein [Actinoplanes sp. N902-109]|uniref:hypothetical protein n=1 Tax=Actinoplanes sp. (strain N902-109) TaxID=649831 RepID=UPI00032951EB|nr:hypothetical protein [Actinoplanes sp. N902-109]AGL21486.1 hypothetical protein L083_7976 [Actinoplanes sp. N902-109]